MAKRKTRTQSAPKAAPTPAEPVLSAGIGRYVMTAVFVSAGLFVLLSLATYTRHDIGDVVPVNEKPANLCGRVGAEIAHWLYLNVGYAAFLLFGALVFWGYLFLRDRITSKVVYQVVGVAVVLAASCGILALNVSEAANLPAGAGGNLGTLLQLHMQSAFDYAGSMLILGTFVVVGLLLSGQFYFVAAVQWAARKTWWATRTAAVAVTPSPRKAADAADIDDPDAVDQVDRSPAAKLKAPSSARKKLKRREEKQQEQEAEDASAGREPVPVRGLAPSADEDEAEAEAEAEAKQDDAGAAATAASDEDAAGPSDDDVEDVASDGISDRARALFKRHKTKKKVEYEAESGLEDKISPARRANPSRYKCPGVELLDEPEGEKGGPGEDFFQQQAARLEQSLNDFNIEARVVNIETGPVVTFYELELAPGIKVNRVTALSDDISMVLKAHSVRVVAPIPGKSTVGIEVPNIDKELVRLRDIMVAGKSAVSKYQIPLFLGKDSQGAPMVLDLAKMPHLLIAGRTGSGKSVCINSLILSVLMTRTPDDVKMILIDPKTVELTPYRQIPHLLSPVVTNMKKAAGVLEWAEQKMDQRFEFLSKAGVRQLSEYNALGENEIRRRLGVDDPEQAVHIPYHMPYIVIIIDELADLMMVGAKDVEHSITRLAQKSRAVGIHVVLATQRPSVDVITGLIKSNLPARISFQVSSKVDSRTILDANGADKLVGSGDMLVLKPGAAKLIRAQGTYVSDAEIERVTGAVQDIVPEFNDDLVQVEQTGGLKLDGNPSDRDELFEDALRVVLESQRGSVSLLQRRLGIGYTRSARLIEMIAEEGYLGEHKGSQAREVLITLDEWEALQAENAETPAGASQE